MSREDGIIEQHLLPEDQVATRRNAARDILRRLYLDMHGRISDATKDGELADGSFEFKRRDNSARSQHYKLGRLVLRGFPLRTDTEQGPEIEAVYRRQVYKEGRFGESLGLWPRGTSGVFYAWTDTMLEWAHDLAGDMRSELLGHNDTLTIRHNPLENEST